MCTKDYIHNKDYTSVVIHVKQFMDDVTEALYQHFNMLADVEYIGDNLHEGVEQAVFFNIYSDIFRLFTTTVHFFFL